MILITGATGQLGKAVVDALLKKTNASNLAVMVRDVAKAGDLKSQGIDVRQGDYNDQSSMTNAFKGIEKLYFVSGNDLAIRSQQHDKVVKAAKAAGVKQVVYTSFQRKNESDSSPIAFVAKSHLDTEAYLKASGLQYTILKHGLYLDMLPLFMGEHVLEQGTIFLPAGNGKTAFALRADMAEAAAHILTSPGHENKVYEISGGTSYSYDDIARILTELSGKTITYVSPASEIYQQEMGKAGMPAEYIGMFAAFSEAIKQGEFDFPDHTLETFLGRKPVTAEAYLKGIYVPVS